MFSYKSTHHISLVYAFLILHKQLILSPVRYEIFSRCLDVNLGTVSTL